MKKFKIGAGFFLLLLVCFVTGNFILVCNYFLALFFHELAHLWVASSKGYTLQQIKLDVFGLAVDLNEKIDDHDQFAVNIAGPICNLLLCVFCMALYWLIPASFAYLNTFCFASLMLALFNLLPVYPLDGGKIFRGIIKNDKAYEALDKIIRFSLAILCICAFVITCFNSVNFLLLVVSLFFILSKNEQTPTMSIFKFRKNKHFDKVEILKVDESETLFSLIKQIKIHHYTIFYVQKRNRFLDEDNVIELSLKHSLTTCIADLK